MWFHVLDRNSRRGMSASDSIAGFVAETPYRIGTRTPRKSPLRPDNFARRCSFATGSYVNLLRQQAARWLRGPPTSSIGTGSDNQCRQRGNDRSPPMNEPAPCADTIATIEEDPFSTSFMRDPYPHYERMREAGPLVYLRLYECFAVARHEEVQKVLSDWETFSSAAGVGLANFNSEKPWRPPSLVLEADPPLHTRTRMVLTRVLSPGNIRKLRDQFEREAEILIDRLVALGRFDGVTDLAEPYPVKVFPDALGLAEQGRENLLPYGSMVFNSFGP